MMHTRLVSRFVQARDLKSGDIFCPLQTTDCWDDDDVLGYGDRIKAAILASPLLSLGEATDVYNSLAWIRSDTPCPDELADMWVLRTEEVTEEGYAAARAESKRNLHALIAERTEEE